MNINESRESIHVRNSDLAESRLSNTNLTGATFDNVNLLRAAFININFSNATLTNVNLTNVSISDANIAGMTINDVLVSDLFRARRRHAGAGSPGAPAVSLTSVMPVLRVQDMQRAIDWYTNIVGFALQWRSPNDGGGENSMLRLGDVVLMLSTGTHPGDKPAFTGTLYFNTPAVSVFHDRIKDRAELVWPLENMDYGTVEFGVRDPDGYVLAFAERRPPA